MSRREQLLDRIRPVLVCPPCRRGLAGRGGDLVCGTSGLVVRCDRIACIDGYGSKTVHVVCDLVARPFVVGSIASGVALEATKPGGSRAR